MVTDSIRKFRSSQNLTASELREFRNYVSQLKKQGVISSKTSAASARPYFLRSSGPKGGKNTLAEIVNKNHAKLTKYQPPQKLLPSSKPISVRDFPHSHNSLANILNDLEKNYKAIDALKKPDERFAFQIHGTDSLRPFRDIRLLTEFLKESESIQQVFRKRGESRDIFNSLKIIRWKGTITGWAEHRHVRRKKPSSKGRQAKYRRSVRK